jgi:hypothetical protein
VELASVVSGGRAQHYARAHALVPLKATSRVGAWHGVARPPNVPPEHGTASSCRHGLRRHVPRVFWGRYRHAGGGIFCQFDLKGVFFVTNWAGWSFFPKFQCASEGKVTVLSCCLHRCRRASYVPLKYILVNCREYICPSTQECTPTTGLFVPRQQAQERVSAPALPP